MDVAAVVALSALSAIAILTLASVGLAVIFGLMRVVNMAHGEFLMIGALTTTSLVNKCGIPWWLGMIAAPFVGAAICSRFCSFRALRKAGSSTAFW
jgi:branched-subunit amino acid ABC-type transport system permease component